jgi:hypothetical protein
MGPRHLVTGVLCFSVVTGASSGQQPTRDALSIADGVIIDGKVTDRSGQPLSAVSVDALPEGGGRATRATTDRGGVYHLEGLPEGTYRLDFSLPGFSGLRRNHVRANSDRRVGVDVVLSVRPLCECVTSGPPADAVIIRGQVVDEAGWPLAHTRLQLAGPKRQETAYADSEGRFRLRPPAEGNWSIVASDSGFAPVTQRISKATTAPLIFRLRFVGSRNLPDSEVFNHQCPCPEYFVFEER